MILSPIVIDSREVHLLNAIYPTNVTLSPIVKDFKLSHLIKKYEEIVVLSSMVTCPFPSGCIPQPEDILVNRTASATRNRRKLLISQSFYAAAKEALFLNTMSDDDTPRVESSRALTHTNKHETSEKYIGVQLARENENKTRKP